MMAAGIKETQAAQALPVKTEREKDYIAALAVFFNAGQGRVSGADCGVLGGDGEAVCEVSRGCGCGGVLCAEPAGGEGPDDMSVEQERKAMAVLTPLFAKYPDQSGGGALHHSCVR